MKQKILATQLNELSPKAEEKLFKWQKKRGRIELLSIGDMIEFLEENYSHLEISTDSGRFERQTWFIEYNEDHRNIGRGLCDCLWEAVKEVLERKHE